MKTNGRARRICDDWTCLCGNETGFEGFMPFDPTADDSGASLGPEWTGLYICRRCGRVIEGAPPKFYRGPETSTPRSPMTLTRLEWDLVARLEAVREAHGLEDHEGGEELSQHAHGVLFQVQPDRSFSPGPLYVIMRNEPGDPPIQITVVRDKLVVEGEWDQEPKEGG